MSDSVKPLTPLAPAAEAEAVYHQTIRLLHWLMAAGFLAMWITGVMVTNMEGVPWWAENDRQGVVRDLHKSIGLTLLAFLVARIALRLVRPVPALPASFSGTEKRLAHLGHAGIYVMIVLTSVTGFAIADLQAYGNAYFGIELPQIFPEMQRVAGWSASPWAYVLHAALAYGFLAIILGHVYFVHMHRKHHGIDVLARMTARPGPQSLTLQRALIAIALAVAVLIAVFATRAFVTLGPAEEPRDYISTTPFAS